MTEAQGQQIIQILTDILDAVLSVAMSSAMIAIAISMMFGVLLLYVATRARLSSRWWSIALLCLIPVQTYAQTDPPDDLLDAGDRYCLDQNTMYAIVKYPWYITYDDLDGYDIMLGTAPDPDNNGAEICQCQGCDPLSGNSCASNYTALYYYVDPDDTQCDIMACADFALDPALPPPGWHYCTIGGSPWPNTISICPEGRDGPIITGTGMPQCQIVVNAPVTFIPVFNGLQYNVEAYIDNKGPYIIERGFPTAFGTPGDETGCPACNDIIGMCIIADQCSITFCADNTEAECESVSGASWFQGAQCSDYGSCSTPDGCQITNSVTCSTLGGVFSPGADCEADCPPQGSGGGGGTVDPDIDDDGIPNENDLDIDGDGQPNGGDDDADGDGIPNVTDNDDDGDGVDDQDDPTPLGPVSGGACCLPDNTCTITTATECTNLGGTFHLDDSCSSVDCNPGGGGGIGGTNTGACCLEDDCQVVTETTCFELQGEWLGLGTNCDDCIDPIGGCCYSDGSCAIITATECTDTAGVYMGDGSDCTLCFDHESYQPLEGQDVASTLMTWAQSWGLPTTPNGRDDTYAIVFGVTLPDGSTSVNEIPLFNTTVYGVDLDMIRRFVRQLLTFVLVFNFVLFVLATIGSVVR
ncbi:MAG: hypothetical protein Tsb0013_02550 [Phycisphaerales bacterium]